MLLSGEGVGCQPQTSVPNTGIQWVSGPEISQSLNEREKVSLSSWPCLGSVGSGLIPQALVLPVPLGPPPLGVGHIPGIYMTIQNSGKTTAMK